MNRFAVRTRATARRWTCLSTLPLAVLATACVAPRPPAPAPAAPPMPMLAQAPQDKPMAEPPSGYLAGTFTHGRGQWRDDEDAERERTAQELLG